MTRNRAIADASFAAGAAALIVVTAFALSAQGVKVALVPLAVLVALVLLAHPGITLALLLGTTVVLEADTQGFLPVTARFYDSLPVGLAVTDLLFGLLLFGVVFDLGRRREAPRLPDPFTLPLVLLAGAAVFGLVMGLAGGGSRDDIFASARLMTFIVVLPFLVVNVIRTRQDAMVAVAGSAALAIYKGLEGTIAWLAGAGRTLDHTRLTYYQPVANWFLLIFILSLIAAVLLRLAIPVWVWLAAPFATLAFVLSFRRSFWIAGVLGLVLVVLFAHGFRGRRRLLPAVGALVLAVWIATANGGAAEIQGSVVVERVRSLAPSVLESNPGDRYRLVEQRNVIEEIRAHPLTGLGLGVPWTAREPIPYHPGGRNYTHVVALWYWLKLGVAGLVAYLWLMAAAVYASYRLSRAPVERVFRAIGLGLFAASLGLVVVETTGSFTGVNLRLTVVLAIVLGWLAANRAALSNESEAATLPAFPGPE